MDSSLVWLALILTGTGSPLAAKPLTVVNNCNSTIWPAVFANSATSSDLLTGWEAASQFSQDVQVEDDFSGRIWGRQECDESGKCKTGTCPGGIACTTAGTIPVSIAELAFTAGGDFYDISLVDGYNLPVEIRPKSSACSIVSCAYDFNPECPQDTIGAVSDDGTTLACNNSEIAINLQYRLKCPQVYLHSSDDPNNVQFMCDDTQGLTVTFCPSGESSGLEGSSSITTSETSTSSSTDMSSTSDSTPPASTTSASAADYSNDDPSGLSGGAIAGIVVGAVAGIAALLLGGLLCLRRRRRRSSDATGAVEPYQPSSTTSPRPGDPSSPTAVSSAYTDGPIGMMREKRKPVVPSDSGSLIPPPVVGSTSSTANPSSDSAQAHIAATSMNSPAEMTETSGERNVDIQRLFEDRRFENELLSFLSRRMDPPPAHPREDIDDDFADSVAPPPTYRES